jgi:hypothetical protein
MWDITFQLSRLSQLIMFQLTKKFRRRAPSIFRIKVIRANQNGDKSKREVNPVLSPCLRNTYLGMNKTGNVTWRSVCVTLVAVENTRSITNSECVCSLNYPACKAHAPYYVVICGMSGSTISFGNFS